MKSHVAFLAVMIGGLTSMPSHAAGLRADFNLDGVVDATDASLWAHYAGRTSYVPRAETVLTTSLRVTPDRRTVLSGETNTLIASGGTGTIHWAFVDDPTPAFGELSATTGVSVAYVGGTLASNIDVIQAWDLDGNLARSYFNVIDASEAASFGKAVIVAGGVSPNDQVWFATDYIANRAYNVLRYRGYPSVNIQYLSYGQTFGANPDINGDGMPDVDNSSALVHVRETFTNWANASESLVVFLVDHGTESGTNGFFNLTGSDTLSATALSSWLDDLQNTYQMDVTVIMDYCYAGTFLAQLTYTGTASRILIASSASGQLTHFLGGGAISFAEMFWGGILQGQDIASAFQLARNGMISYQNGMLDADGDGIFDELLDLPLVTGRTIGASFVAGKDYPIIGKVVGNQVLDEGVSALLWADDIQGYYPLERVWCSIIEPSYISSSTSGIPELSIPEADLVFDAQRGRHQQTVDGFAEQGPYTINFFAQDIWGSISPPRVSAVFQNGLTERLILVNAHPTNHPAWESHEAMANRVYNGFRVRQIPPERIWYLSAAPYADADGDGTNDVSGTATMDALIHAVIQWGGTTDVMNIYLIGATENGEFQFADGDTLSGPVFKNLLDGTQDTNRSVRVIMEFPSAGAYIPQLAAPAGRERIVIAATQAGRSNDVGQAGLPGFTSHFMSFITEGQPIGRAYLNAQRTMGVASMFNVGLPKQRPIIDDNGDGIPDAKYLSTFISAKRYFGAAFVTGNDVPRIGSVMPDQPIGDASAMTLWVRDVLDVNGVAGVEAIVRPPGAVSDSELVRTGLVYNAVTGRYEAEWTDFSRAGNYSVTFQAENTLGKRSLPVVASLIGPDAYEPDDSSDEANGFFEPGSRLFNIHEPLNEDWSMIFFTTNSLISSNNNLIVQVRQLGENLDAILDIYFEEDDGSLSLVESVDETGPGAIIDNDPSEVFSIVQGEHPEGFYYISVRPADTNYWGEGSEYELNIGNSAAGTTTGLIVAIAQKFAPNPGPPPDATLWVNGTNRGAFGTKNNLYLPLSAGMYTVQVLAAHGFQPLQDPKAANQVSNPNNFVYGNPKIVQVTTTQTTRRSMFFTPEIIATNASVRDAFTGELLQDVVIEFGATATHLSNRYYRCHPAYATNYAVYWFTGIDGSFPAEIILPASGFNLRLSKPGYHTNFMSNVITSPSPGEIVNLNMQALLTPIDLNTNGISDAWEMHYFGSLINATNDADGDGLNNRAEYLAGTNPTNSASFLTSGVLMPGGDNMQLTWPVVPGRSYRVASSTQLVVGGWSSVFGPVTATVAQSEMTFAVTNLLPGAPTFRVELISHP